MEQIRLVYPSPSQHDDAPALTEMGLSRLDSAPVSAQEVDEYLGATRSQSAARFRRCEAPSSRSSPTHNR